MAEVVNSLNSPFVGSDGGDVYVYDDLPAMYRALEAADASSMDLFDATGRPLEVRVDGFAWTVAVDRVNPPEPERLLSILRSYFERLPEEFSGYRARATHLTRLPDLLTLRQELAREPAPGIWARLVRRSWG